MKKLLLALTFSILPLKVFAYQDYMIFSDKPVKGAVSEDKSIADVLPVQTIDNFKQTILFKAKKEGKTVIIIKTSEGDRRLEVSVKDDDTVFKGSEGFEFLPCDIPPENIKINGVDILPPPVKKGDK